jgi:hypothetical protein
MSGTIPNARLNHTTPSPRPERTRRERLELAFWFAVGGIGGLLLAAAVRVAEVVLAWT